MQQISRQDAIRSQLETAIWLWFNGGDPASVHTLACAALKVAHDLGKKYGKGAILFDKLPKQYAKQAIEAQGFFKHAYKDPHKVLTFNPGISEYHMWDALVLYDKLFPCSRTKIMTIFLIRFSLVHPDVTFTNGLPKSFDKAAFAKLHNKQFFAAILPMIK